ncbi:MAG: hypothetical protein A3C47_01875 [Omnitrophica bacterium RIFCSPHIGHO2_02_FULL_51_18]|nr:MAG: hypothetical protein A3C47_01875 [Omnitrophica bacterium RIFCSPHIGHO2_02_FULL_51_18]
MSPNPFAPRKYGELHKVTGRVYIFRNITNSSFVIGGRSVAVIDTQVNFPAAQEFLKALRSVTDKPIEYVINTHYHWDHTNGNQLFKDQGAAVISSKLTKEFMGIRAPRQKEFLAGRGFELGPDPLLPELTFQGEHTIDIGNMPLRLFFAGCAETDDATAVHVIKEGVLMSGDTVMTGSFPIFGQPVWDEGLQGDNQWIDTISKLISLKPKHIIPGHGPLAHDSEIAFLIRLEKYFIKEVRKLVEKDYSLDRVLKELEPRLPDWITGLPIVWGTPRYAILRVFRGLTKKRNDPEPGWQKFKPSAIPQKDVSAYLKSKAGKEMPQDFLAMAHEAAEGGDTVLKLSILKKASEVFPQSADILTVYADALIDASRMEASVLEKGDFFQGARECWHKVLSAHPDHVGALLGKGRYLTMMAYRSGDDPKEGMKLLEKAAGLKPGGRPQAEAEFYLGMGYRRLGNEAIAKGQFGKALKADPGFKPALLAGQSY